jgi:hypothetical protein
MPYLEEEAYGEIPPRFRMYGFVNDSEFIRHAAARGIEVFGIVFECQGWEFPVEYDADGRVVALNELRGAGQRGWAGLREFSQDAGPRGWKPFRHYFPDGLTNSLGEPVTDLWDECASRDLDGRPLHAQWVEAPDREHQGYCMDRNNPVWREYLKAIIRIQIDAGVAGIQLDEAETPLRAMRYGGCFCKDCMAQFRSYLQRASGPGGDPGLASLGLETFDYRAYLVGSGFKAGDPPQSMPLYRHFCQFLVEAVTATFQEMADYIRQYAASVGRRVKVAGNFFNCFPEYDAMVAASDLLITEMRITGARQPWWFRHAAGFSQGKDVVLVENPYGGVIPQLVEELNQGKSYDLFRLSIYEGAAMGTSMTLPYGSWLGSEIEDSYWAPKVLTDEVGQFLESIDGLRSRVSANEVAVLYSVAGNLQADVDSDKWAARYRTVVAAGCRHVSRSQHEAIADYLRDGGDVLIVGDYALNLPPATRQEVTMHQRARTTALASLAGQVTDPQLICSETEVIAVNLDALSSSETALHIVSYGFDRQLDACTPRENVHLGVRTRHPVSAAIIHAPGRPPEAVAVTRERSRTRLSIPRLDTYAVVHLRA